MFTGLIEDVGTIGDLRLQQKSAVLTVKTKLPVRSMARGASVAVNGACLTVVKKGRRSFYRGCLAGNFAAHQSGKLCRRKHG